MMMEVMVVVLVVTPMVSALVATLRLRVVGRKYRFC
jgi:hypothetical protein